METAIKPKALCIFRNVDKILVSEYIHQVTKKPFYRPPGGTIEFGESSELAVIREIDEELNAEIRNLRLLGTFENIYHYKGKLSHEILFIYDGDFVNPEYYVHKNLTGYEHTDHSKFKMVWTPLTDFLEENARLYPEGLLDLVIADLINEKGMEHLKKLHQGRKHIQKSKISA